MRKIYIERLERDDNLRDFLYHIKGIIEASDNVDELVKVLNDAYGHDAEVFADTTSLIEVQTLHHLEYHVKALRIPLRRLQREAYAHVEKDTPSVPRRARKRTGTARAKHVRPPKP